MRKGEGILKLKRRSGSYCCWEVQYNAAERGGDGARLIIGATTLENAKILKETLGILLITLDFPIVRLSDCHTAKYSSISLTLLHQAVLSSQLSKPRTVDLVKDSYYRMVSLIFTTNPGIPSFSSTFTEDLVHA